MSAKNPASTTDKLHNLRHSLAHLLASSVLDMFPEAKLGVGPVIDTGFFYDFELPRPLIPEDLAILEDKMKALIKQNLPFERQPVSAQQAKDFFTAAQQPFKVELVEDIEKHGTTVFSEISGGGAPEDKGPVEITLYKTGNFVDLCRGGHVEATREIDFRGFKLMSIAGAYWRGDATRPQLQRIYGVAFLDKAALTAHLTMLEEAKKRDHKKLGLELDLFVFSDLVGGGLPLWTPKGTALRNVLDAYVWELRKARGYEKVEIPHITKKDLYETSGHWEKYKDDLFRITTREDHEFAMKPMNCPHHTQLYNRKKWSYREMPQRYANTTMCYRDEQSGELSGLSRLRAFTQDDAHVFTRFSQAREEILKIWDIIETFYGTMGFELQVRLSLRDPKKPDAYLGTDAGWKKAEDELRAVVAEKGVTALDGFGEAAFYGPKLDFLGKDAIGRDHQVATIQLDLNMPERFDLTCVAEDGSDERIVMIHAAIMGSIERFLSIIIEHFAGAFPFWMAPLQVRILPINEKVLPYAEDVLRQLQDAGFLAELDSRNESLGKKVRDAEMQKIPHMLVIGEKEAEAGTLTLRRYKKQEQETVSIDAYLSAAKKEAEGRVR